MRIIILGASGYLGKKVADSLARQGHTLLCVIRDGETHFTQTYEKVSVSQLPFFLKNCRPYNCMINFSCKYPKSGVSDKEIVQSNLTVPWNVFYDCMKNGVQQFITLGTGLPDNFNLYSFSKAKLAEILRWYAIQNEGGKTAIRVCNVKLENFYGEDEPEDRFLPGVVRKLKKNQEILLTDGDQLRDFIYVEDVVRAIVILTETQNMPSYLDFPLGTGEAVPVRTVIEYLKELTGSSSPLLFGALPKRKNEPNSVADTRLMKRYEITVAHDWKKGFQKFINNMRD